MRKNILSSQTILCIVFFLCNWNATVNNGIRIQIHCLELSAGLFSTLSLTTCIAMLKYVTTFEITYFCFVQLVGPIVFRCIILWEKQATHRSSCIMKSSSSYTLVFLAYNYPTLTILQVYNNHPYFYDAKLHLETLNLLQEKTAVWHLKSHCFIKDLNINNKVR